ncbi:putative DNA helicase chromatin remodeling SNF2 family [Helianthus anomalus]
MNIGLESLKEIHPSSNQKSSEDGQECDHSYILKDYFGYACRVCGLIQTPIESIIEFQRPKSAKSIRTYYNEDQKSRSGGASLDGVKLPGIDTDTSPVSVNCQEMLLTSPSLLILDEGHTARNKQTNIYTAIDKVQTPRKVVLSGTLYQNNVTEVFNTLNLARPRFLKKDESKGIKRRILSMVEFKSHLKKDTDNEFYELVKHTLLKDDNFKRKVAIIENLREMTSSVLHYYKGDLLDELPGLVNFSVFLKLTPNQVRAVSELKKVQNVRTEILSLEPEFFNGDSSPGCT